MQIPFGKLRMTAFYGYELTRHHARETYKERQVVFPASYAGSRRF